MLGAGVNRGSTAHDIEGGRYSEHTHPHKHIKTYSTSATILLAKTSQKGIFQVKQEMHTLPVIRPNKPHA